MALGLALVLVTAHFVGDFICQSDWMAVNKSKDWGALLIHVGAYTVVLLAAVIVILLLDPRPQDADAARLFLLVNAAAHFVQDAITSRINARLWFVDGARVKGRAMVNVCAYVGAIGTISVDEALKAVDDELQMCGSGLEVVYNDKRHWFFVGIGVDQLLHYVTLVVTAEWWLL